MALSPCGRGPTILGYRSSDGTLKHISKSIFLNDYLQASGQKNFQDCLARIEAHLTHFSFAVYNSFSVVDPFWLVFYRWGKRQNYDMKTLYPAYTQYADHLLKRSSVSAAIKAEGILF